MKTTLNAIRERSPCSSGWTKLLAHLNKTKADDEPLSFLTILESNGLDDALWCMRAAPEYDKEWRRFAIFCARQVEYFMTEQRSKDALDIAERFIDGTATREEMETASRRAAAADDATATARWAARRAAAADDGTAAASWAAATATATATAADADAREVQRKEFIRMVSL